MKIDSSNCFLNGSFLWNTHRFLNGLSDPICIHTSFNLINRISMHSNDVQCLWANGMYLHSLHNIQPLRTHTHTHAQSLNFLIRIFQLDNSSMFNVYSLVQVYVYINLICLLMRNNKMMLFEHAQITYYITTYDQTVQCTYNQTTCKWVNDVSEVMKIDFFYYYFFFCKFIKFNGWLYFYHNNCRAFGQPTTLQTIAFNVSLDKMVITIHRNRINNKIIVIHIHVMAWQIQNENAMLWHGICQIWILYSSFVKMCKFISLNFVFDSAAHYMSFGRYYSSWKWWEDAIVHITNCKLQIDLYNNGNRP